MRRGAHGLDSGRLCGLGVSQGRCAGVKETQTRGDAPLSPPTRSLGGGALRPHAPLPPTRPCWPAQSPPAPHARRPSTHSPPAPPHPPPPSAGLLGDLHSFDPATMTWTLLSAADDAPRPSARWFHGFTSAGGLLYVHGGRGITDADGNIGDGNSFGMYCR